MMGLEEALAECLASLERGRSVEECLARYSGLGQELEPLLRTALGLQQTYDVNPRPSFQRAARQRFLAAAGRRGARPLAVAQPPRRFSFGWPWAPAALAAAAAVAAVALVTVLALAGKGGGPGEPGVIVRQITPTTTSAPPATETAPGPEEIDALVARLETQLNAMQEQVAQGAVIPSEAIEELKDINQSLEQTLPAAHPEAAEAAPQIAGLLDQQQRVLSDAKEQHQVAPEAADAVDEVIRIAGTIQDLLSPTATPTPTPAPTGTPAPSSTATPEPGASETATPASSPGPGLAGGEIIVPLTPTPSP